MEVVRGYSPRFTLRLAAHLPAVLAMGLALRFVGAALMPTSRYPRPWSYDSRNDKVLDALGDYVAHDVSEEPALEIVAAVNEAEALRGERDAARKEISDLRDEFVPFREEVNLAFNELISRLDQDRDRERAILFEARGLLHRLVLENDATSVREAARDFLAQT